MAGTPAVASARRTSLRTVCRRRQPLPRKQDSGGDPDDRRLRRWGWQIEAPTRRAMPVRTASSGKSEPKFWTIGAISHAPLPISAAASRRTLSTWLTPVRRAPKRWREAASSCLLWVSDRSWTTLGPMQIRKLSMAGVRGQFPAGMLP